MAKCEQCSQPLAEELPANCERCGKPVIWQIGPRGDVRVACEPIPVQVMLRGGCITRALVLHAPLCKPPEVEAPPFLDAAQAGA